jgi:hypothetical protein
MNSVNQAGFRAQPLKKIGCTKVSPPLALCRAAGAQQHPFLHTPAPHRTQSPARWQNQSCSLTKPALLTRKTPIPVPAQACLGCLPACLGRGTVPRSSSQHTLYALHPRTAQQSTDTEPRVSTQSLRVGAREGRRGGITLLAAHLFFSVQRVSKQM